MASAPSTTASTLAPPLRSPFSSPRAPRLPTTLRLPPPRPASARWRVAPAPGRLARARARVRCGAAVKFIGQSEFEAEVLRSELPVLVDFVADWCGPCRLIAPVVDWASELAPSPPSLPGAAAPAATPGRSSLHFHLANAGAAALVAASLLVADPALAFKGGGPYGQQVTRGQDLTGKDFSGQTLIKQDFNFQDKIHASLQ